MKFNKLSKENIGMLVVCLIAASILIGGTTFGIIEKFNTNYSALVQLGYIATVVTTGLLFACVGLCGVAICCSTKKNLNVEPNDNELKSDIENQLKIQKNLNKDKINPKEKVNIIKKSEQKENKYLRNTQNLTLFNQKDNGMATEKDKLIINSEEQEHKTQKFS